MEQGFLGPKPEAQRSLREAALVRQIADVSEGWPVVGPPDLQAWEGKGLAQGHQAVARDRRMGGWNSHSCSLTSCPWALLSKQETPLWPVTIL